MQRGLSKMKKIAIKMLVFFVAFLLLVAVAACAQGDADTGAAYPSRDITIIVPWGAGGGADLTNRVLAEQMQTVLGVNMPVLNMPGAGGSIGLQDVFDSPRDGYRMLGTSMASLATIDIMGLSEVSYRQWVAWKATFSPNTVAVPADSPHQTLDDLIAAMAANPGAVLMGSGGAGTSGHIGGLILAEVAGVTFNHIPYEGGSPAIIATMGGEVEFNTQLLSEMIDHIRSGTLRALATLSEQPIEVIGSDGQVIVIPSAADYVPELAAWLPLGGSNGMMVPADSPEHVIIALDEAFHYATQTASVQDFAAERGMFVAGFTMAQTAEYLENIARRVGWTLWDAGVAPVSPEELGIPRP